MRTIKEIKKAFNGIYREDVAKESIETIEVLLSEITTKLANEDGRISSKATLEWLEHAKNTLEETLSELNKIDDIDEDSVKIGKPALCMCGCGESLPSNTMLKVHVANRGGRVGYVCPTCADKVLPHNTENLEKIGSGDTWTFGCEFECVNPSVTFRASLMASKYLPTENSSLGENGVEFISPISYGFKSFHKLSETIENLMRGNEVEVNNDCGTHVHIGHTMHINANSQTKLLEYFAQIFTPLSNAMRDNKDMTIALFGRDFNSFAEPITESSDNNTSRYFFANCQNPNTIEYRICKYVNRKQFDLAIKTCKEFTSAIVNNFLKNYNGNKDNDSHKAKIASGKLVKLFHKFGKQALELSEKEFEIAC